MFDEVTWHVDVCTDLTAFLFPSRPEHYKFLGSDLYQSYITLCL